MITEYGPGDPETWGPPTGHSNDPRVDTTYDDECPSCYRSMGSEFLCEHCEYEIPEPDYEMMYEDSFGEPL